MFWVVYHTYTTRDICLICTDALVVEMVGCDDNVLIKSMNIQWIHGKLSIIIKQMI